MMSNPAIGVESSTKKDAHHPSEVDGQVQKGSFIKKVAPYDAAERDGNCNIIGDLYKESIHFLQTLMPKLQRRLPPDSFRVVKQSAQTFHLWGGGFGAAQGNLDTMIRESKELFESSLSVLMSIAELLIDGFSLQVSPDPVESEESNNQNAVAAVLENAYRQTSIPLDVEESREQGERSNDADDLAASFENLVDCLTCLGPAIEFPAHDPIAQDRSQLAAYLVERPAHDRFADKIRSRYPRADPALIERLGKLNWERYRNICRLRESADAVSQFSIDEDNISRDQDSGIGSSVPSQRDRSKDEDEMTVFSSRANSSHKMLPTLPAEGRRGKHFTCEVCYRLVRITRLRDWKKHIFKDILAYACLFAGCRSDNVLFDGSDAMTAHLAAEHSLDPSWRSLQCPLCLEATGDGRTVISTHLIRHMEQIASGSLPANVPSDDDNEEHSSSEGELSPKDPVETPSIDQKLQDTHENSDRSQSKTTHAFDDIPSLRQAYAAGRRGSKANETPKNDQSDTKGSVYDSDDALPPDSPPLVPFKPRSRPSPTPPPFIPRNPPVIQDNSNRRKRRNRRQTPSQGDPVFISYLDPNRPDIARDAGRIPLDVSSSEFSMDENDGSPIRDGNAEA